MSAEKPNVRPPAGLGQRGRAFWRHVMTGYELSESERQVLWECCRTMDELDLLRAAVDSQGVTVSGSEGQHRAHPAFMEMSRARQTLSRLLAQLALEGDDGSVLPSSAQLKARRWRRHGGGHTTGRRG